ASAAKVGVTQSVVDMMVDMDKLSSLEDTNVLGSFPPLSTPDITMASNAPDKSSYANVTGKPSGKKMNIRTLFTSGANRIDVVVPVESIRAISECFANTSYGFFLGKRVAYPVVTNYVRNTWGKYGLVCSMFNSSTRLFSFQFSSMEGLDSKMKGVECTIQVSNSNPFVVLNSVDNDVEFGTNGGTSNLGNNEANDGEFASNKKIDKIERQISEGKLRLLDNDGNLLVPTG
ncbi:hypothetical protein Tco_0235450, partial [Tanacetum coccineum]